MKTLVAASLASAGLILSAPFMGQLRGVLRATFPAQFVVIVSGAVAAAIVIALVVALFRIRERRAMRYSFIATALILGAGYSSATRIGLPEVDAVEAVHFVEYGLITFLFYRAWRPLGDPAILILPVLLGLLVGTLEEWFQWFIPNRIGEVRDVFLNLAAVGAGLLFSVGIDPPSSFTGRLRASSLARVSFVAAIVVLVFAMFLDTVHIGAIVTHLDIGSFRSRYRAEELMSIARERATRWRTDPPVVLERLSREDQYLDEGLWHIRRRNEAWTAGDRLTAWKENRILEEFFAPVLDTPSYVSAAGHRWHPDQRAESERGAAGAEGVYISSAEPYPILIWPRPLFWTLISILVALLLSCALRFRRRAAASGRPMHAL